MDGKIMDEALSIMGLNRGWLKEKLDAQGLRAENVFLAQVDGAGQLYLDLADDQLNMPQPQEKASLYALLKKCEADLELFALSTQDNAAKAMYAKHAEQMQQLLHQLKPLLHS